MILLLTWGSWHGCVRHQEQASPSPEHCGCCKSVRTDSRWTGSSLLWCSDGTWPQAHGLSGARPVGHTDRRFQPCRISLEGKPSSSSPWFLTFPNKCVRILSGSVWVHSVIWNTNRKDSNSLMYSCKTVAKKHNRRYSLEESKMSFFLQVLNFYLSPHFKEKLCHWRDWSFYFTMKDARS